MRPSRWLCGMLILCLAVSGCRRPDAKPTIRLQLNWVPDAQFGGYYAAWLHKEYAAEGLDVEILPGGPGVAVIPKLVTGAVQFGIGNADQVLMARGEGGPVVAVMASMQESPRCILVHRKKGFESLRDLRDVTLAAEEGSAFMQFLKREAKLANVRFVSYSGSIAKFLLDDDFAQQGYVFSEPVVARRKGSDAQALMLSEVGFNPYSGVVITTDRYARDHPQTVAAFVRATCRGWRRYLEDAAETNAYLLARNPDMDAASLSEAVEIIRELCIPQGQTSEKLGTMIAERWTTLAEQLRGLQMLELKDEDVQRCFRLDFLNNGPKN